MRIILAFLYLISVSCPLFSASSASRNFGGDGSFDHIDIGTFDLSGDSLTLMAWFNTDTNDKCGGRIVSKATSGAANDHIWMLGMCSDGNLRARIRFGGTTTTLVDTGDLISENVWHHGAVVYDGADIILYQDGVNIASVGQTGDFDTDGAVTVSIGTNGSETNDNTWQGELVDVRIYDRSLTAQEINEAMLCRNSSFDTLEAGYTLLGDDFTDFSGNGHDGTDSSTGTSNESPGTSWCGGAS